MEFEKRMKSWFARFMENGYVQGNLRIEFAQNSETKKVSKK